VAVQGGESVRAARLWGAAEALKESIGIAYDAPFIRSQYDYEGLLTTMRDRLGEAAFERARAEGKDMTQDRVVKYALSEDEDVPPAVPAPQRPAPTKPQDLLTRREEEIAVLITRGLTNRQIALELTLSERTVDCHVAKILKKLGLRSRVQVAAWVTEQGPLP
jgi:serine/threonine-protein kinase PknK